jgi:hypothetical protein
MDQARSTRSSAAGREYPIRSMNATTASSFALTGPNCAIAASHRARSWRTTTVSGDDRTWARIAAIASAGGGAYARTGARQLAGGCIVISNCRAGLLSTPLGPRRLATGALPRELTPFCLSPGIAVVQVNNRKVRDRSRGNGDVGGWPFAPPVGHFILVREPALIRSPRRHEWVLPWVAALVGRRRGRRAHPNRAQSPSSGRR